MSTLVNWIELQSSCLAASPTDLSPACKFWKKWIIMSLQLYLCITNSDLHIFYEILRVKKEKIFYSTLTVYTSLLELIAEGLNKQKNILQE